MKYSLIIGSSGQDGTLLRFQYLRSGTPYIGITRNCIEIYNSSKITIKKFIAPPLTFSFYLDCLSSYHICSVFYFAAFNKPSVQTCEYLEYKTELDFVNVQGFINLLDYLFFRDSFPYIFYASSCLIYDLSLHRSCNESSIYSPSCLYSESKVKAIDIARSKYTGAFRIVNAILFNHESPLRPSSYLSSRVIRHCLMTLGQSSYPISVHYPNNIFDFSRASFFVGLFSKLPSTGYDGDLVFGSSSSDSIISFVNTVCQFYHLQVDNLFRFESPGDRNRLAYSDCRLLVSLFPFATELSAPLSQRVLLLLNEFSSFL